MRGAVFFVIIGGVLTAFACYFWQYSLRTIIAHQCIRKAVGYIRAQQWGALAKILSRRSSRWRFMGRNYMLVIGYAARRWLASADLLQWQMTIDADPVLRLHAAQLEGKDSAKIEEYLITQYSNDVGLLPIWNAVVVLFFSSFGFAVALTLILYGLSRLP
jgi:hypothetical protein